MPSEVTRKMVKKKGIGQAALELDVFKEAFRFRLPDGRNDYNSWKGLCMTVFLLTCLTFYGVMQAMKLVTYDETDVMVS